jgi:hypothetical protein
MREIERPEHIIKATGERACRSLDVQTQAGVTHLMGSRKWQSVAG